MDWSKLPDLAVVTLLACAFASAARRSQSSVSNLWLTGWMMIVVQFTAFLFAPAAGSFASIVEFIGLASLAWAGILFIWASIPCRGNSSSFWIMSALLGTNTLYIALLVFSPAVSWALTLAAALFGVLPLAITLLNLHRDNHGLRWVKVVLYGALSLFLLAFQFRPGSGLHMALNAVFFTIFFSCGIHFFHAYRRATAGAFITISGFVAWASVFVLGSGAGGFMRNLPRESEVWNLPKFVVAVGMILLLLEEQIEHNKYLALHDELTGLPNRRLFQDRLASALEHARRNKSSAALLVVDLDRFKQVNDAHGHHVGDQLLNHVGKIISSRIRRSDTVARTGGDEFSVILREPASREDAAHIGDTLIELLTEPVELGNQTIRIGASVGIAVFQEDASDGEGLCIVADKRMYDYKNRTACLERTPRPPVHSMISKAELTANLQQVS